MKRLLNIGAILFSLTVFVLGVRWAVRNIATADSLTWFATPALTVLLRAVIIAAWLLAIVLPLRWWLRAHRRTVATAAQRLYVIAQRLYVMLYKAAIPHAEHDPSLNLKNRPVWRRGLVLAGAVCLLLASIGLCIGSQRSRYAAGLAGATPELYQVGLRTGKSGISLFYQTGNFYGIALSERRLAWGGVAVSSRTKLEGHGFTAFASWWIVIGFVSVLVAFAARDMAVGVRLSGTGGRREMVGRRKRVGEEKGSESVSGDCDVRRLADFLVGKAMNP